MNRTATLAQTIGRKAAHLVAVVVVLGAALFIGSALDTTPAAAERPATDASASALVTANDCWTDEAPADVTVPGRVVVSKGERTWIGGERVVAQALAQTFEGADHGLTVHGFCR